MLNIILKKSKRKGNWPVVNMGGAKELQLIINPKTLADFTYSKRSNALKLASLYSESLYGYQIDIDSSELKCYQDLLALAFIINNLPEKSRILDVGGGHSRVLRHLSNNYECWCIDKYEGLGNGPKEIPENTTYRIVNDYMGNFSNQLPDGYFDLVFSISSLEHAPRNRAFIENILKDINRVIKNGGFSLHCLDLTITRDQILKNYLIHHLFYKQSKYKLPAFNDILNNKDLYVLPKNIFKNWNLKRSYDEISIIDSCFFWMKD